MRNAISPVLAAFDVRFLWHEWLQLRPDFVGDHLANLTVLGDAALCGVGYVPVDDPFRTDHVAQIGHVHLGDIVKLDVRKMRDVPGLMATQIVANLTPRLHCWT